MPDDDQFERYLQQFRPIVAEPLPLPSRRPVRLWQWSLAAAAALAIVMIAAVAVRVHRHPTPAPARSSAQLTRTQPLTLGRADDLLAHAPSYDSAIDGLAFQCERIQVPPGSESALETLSKENLKP